MLDKQARKIKVLLTVFGFKQEDNELFSYRMGKVRGRAKIKIKKSKIKRQKAKKLNGTF
jgi:hypothetical protein